MSAGCGPVADLAEELVEEEVEQVPRKKPELGFV